MVFVYTREAHPGENYPAHASLEAKLANARTARESWTLARPMLVDDLAGAVHRAYGALPNMTYVIGRDGKVVHRAEWTDEHTLSFVLEYLTREGAQRRAGKRIRPYYMESAMPHALDMQAFMQGLTVAGPRAIEEFISGMARAYGEPAAAPLRAWWEVHRDAKLAGGGG